MKARDVMTRRVVWARADTPVGDLARLLLENHISAVPVLNGAGEPIGMVGEGDLIGRDEAGRPEHDDAWLAMLEAGKPLSADALSSARARSALDVMSNPVVTVFEDTDVGEIARLFQGSRIKCAPVVRNGRMVGIVSRADLLRAMSRGPQAARPAPQTGSASHGGVSPAPDPPAVTAPVNGQTLPADYPSPSVADFRRLVNDHEAEERRQREHLRWAAAEARRRAVAERIGRHISDEAWRNLLHRARLAAEGGAEEFLLLRFPCELCSDGGRAVNAPEPDWPGTLRGDAAEVYDRWKRELSPQGFHLAARIVDFVDGMPSNAGIFLVWR